MNDKRDELVALIDKAKEVKDWALAHKLIDMLSGVDHALVEIEQHVAKLDDLKLQEEPISDKVIEAVAGTDNA